MTAVEKALEYLADYDGRPISIMEVCGTHTAAIFKSGIRGLISGKIRLVSGPGCPVCVTAPGYIDKLLGYAMAPGCCVLSFGDMLKVPGRNGSLQSQRGEGANFRMIYSPFQALELAQAEPNMEFIAAAVGFETTAPAWAMVADEALKRGIHNLRLLCAIKTILPAMELICQNEQGIDAFICPGHVSAIIGADAFLGLCSQYKKPMVVAGFEAGHIIAAVYSIMLQLKHEQAQVRNLYAEAVSSGGNIKAQELLSRCFLPGDADWRGLGQIALSGLYLQGEYAALDAGSLDVGSEGYEDPACRCADVICGRINPSQCPLFGLCSPTHPVGPCMVSEEGACGIWYGNSEVSE